MQATREPTLFHVGCTSTEPVLFHTGCGSLQSQSFFILDVGHYRANHFSCRMYFHRACLFSYWMWVSTEPVLFHTGCRPLHLYLTMGGPAYHHVKRTQHLHLTMGGTNPTTMSERIMDSSLPLGRSLSLEKYKLLPEVLKLHSDHF